MCFFVRSGETSSRWPNRLRAAVQKGARNEQACGSSAGTQFPNIRQRRYLCLPAPADLEKLLRGIRAGCGVRGGV